MATKRFHLELEVDNVDTKEKEAAVLQAFKIVGRQLFVSTMLIVGDNPKPEITLWAEDFESGRSSVSLKPEEGEDE